VRRVFAAIAALLLGIILALLLAPHARAAKWEEDWGPIRHQGYLFDGQIGYSAGYQLYDAGGLLQQAKDMQLDLPTEGMVVHQFTMLGSASERVRFGGSFFWGSERITGAMSIAGDSFSRELTTSLCGGGFLLEYTPLVYKRFALSAGTLIGAGTANIHLRQDDGTVSWGEATSPYRNDPATTPGNNTKIDIDRGFFLLHPHLTARYFILNWMAIEGQAGWQFDTLNEDGWMLHSNRLSGKGPDISFRQPFFRLGIALGG